MWYTNILAEFEKFQNSLHDFFIYFSFQIVTDFEDVADNFFLNCIYVSDLHCSLIVVQVPWWALALLCLSKRLHSIFVLRLFNDCLAMLLLHASLASFLHQRWHLGLIIFR